NAIAASAMTELPVEPCATLARHGYPEVNGCNRHERVNVSFRMRMLARQRREERGQRGTTDRGGAWDWGSARGFVRGHCAGGRLSVAADSRRGGLRSRRGRRCHLAGHDGPHEPKPRPAIG